MLPLDEKSRRLVSELNSQLLEIIIRRKNVSTLYELWDITIEEWSEESWELAGDKLFILNKITECLAKEKLLVN